MSDLSPGGLSCQHRILLLVLGLAMIGGRLWDMRQAPAVWSDWAVIGLGIVVLAVTLLVGRGRAGR